MGLLEDIRSKAIQNAKRIVLPESLEERILTAADKLLQEDIAKIILLATPEEIKSKAGELGLSNIEKAHIVNPKEHDKKDEYADLLVELRKHKGMTKEEALELVGDPLYLSTLMIKNGDADGEVAGANNATGDVLRPAFRIVKTKPGFYVVSGAFIMMLDKKEFGENGTLVFADCAVHPDPTAEELAQIAVATGHTTKAIAGFDPRVALLSFSTKGSASHEMVDKVVEATRIAKEKAPELKIDGEMQADAAIVDKIGNKKASDSDIAGKANVLIFPNLETGNIAYKLVQRTAGAEAVGPVLQGMAAPINDLSRGCSVDDIVNLVAITANQAAAASE